MWRGIMLKTGGIRLLAATAAILLMATGCAKQGARTVISDAGARNEQALGELSKEVATLKAELNKREASRSGDSLSITPTVDSTKATSLLDVGAPNCSTLAENDAVAVV